MDSSEQGDGLLNHAFWLYRRQHPGVLTEPEVLPDLHRPVECVHDALHDCVSPALLGARIPTPLVFLTHSQCACVCVFSQRAACGSQFSSHHVGLGNPTQLSDLAAGTH